VRKDKGIMDLPDQLREQQAYILAEVGGKGRKRFSGQRYSYRAGGLGCPVVISCRSRRGTRDIDNYTVD